MNVEQFLTKHEVPYLRMVHGDVYTAQELAAREHVSGMKVAKPVLVKADDEFLLCVVPAACRVDLPRLAQLTGHTSAILATEDDMRRIFADCEVGAEPPLGGPYGVPTWMDASLRRDDFIVFQSGRHTEAVKIARSDYERVAKPSVGDFARHL